MSLWELFKEGGFIMYPLLLCSVAVWAVVFEKLWGYHKFVKESEVLYNTIKELINNKQIEDARGACLSAQELIKAPYLVLFEKGEMDQQTREDRINRRLSETQQGLKRFLWVLGTVGNAAPFIGLFGTVVGIIKSFESMAQSGRGGFSVVAAGLSEALVATAAGIIVAVMAVIFYNYFLNKLNHVFLCFKNRVEDLFDLMPKS